MLASQSSSAPGSTPSRSGGGEMKGCMNALTFLVILAVIGFLILAIIGWIGEGDSSTVEDSGQAGRTAPLPAVVRVVEVI